MALKIAKTYAVLSNVKFIAPTDEALGKKADYDKYLENLDIKHLDLSKDIKPTIFHLQPMSARDYLMFRQAATLNYLESKETKDGSSYKETLSQLQNFTHYTGAVLEHVLVGVTNLNLEDKDGTVEVINWEPGSSFSDKDKARVLDILKSDLAILDNIQTAIKNLCGLSEDEKKP